MKVSVIVPCFNAAPTLGLCLTSLLEQSLSAHEIIVVDDASSDLSVEVAEGFGASLHQRSENGGAAAARAEGASRATGEVLAFIDADCVAPEDWLQKIVDSFCQDPELGGVGGRYTHECDGSWLGSLCAVEESYVHEVFSRHPDQATPPGGNCAYRKSVWDEGRSQRELSFFAGMGSGEDSLVGHELRQIARLRFTPELEVRHHSRGGGGYFRRHFNRGISRSTILLNQLSDAEESSLNFEAYGGWGLFLSGLLFVAGVGAGASALALGSPALLTLAAVCFVAQLLSGRDFYRFASAYTSSLSSGSRPRLGFWLALPALLVARSLCWGAGIAVATRRTLAFQLARCWNIVCSILHFWRPGRISKLFYFVTSQCNARCDFCFNLDNVVDWKKRKETELSLEEVTQIARGFGRLPYLTLSGGEPFVRQDLPGVIRAFHEHAKTQWVTIPTNAALTARTLRSVSEIMNTCPGIFLTIQVSLDSMGEDHDRSRKISGGFAKMAETLHGLSRLRKRYKNLRVQIATCYDDFNLHRQDEISDYLRKNFDYDQQMFYLIRETRVGITNDLHLLDSYLDRVQQTEAYEQGAHKQGIWHRAVRALHSMVYTDMATIKKEKKFLRPCHAIQKFATLYDDGQVTPCEILEYSELGNIRDHGYDFYQLKRAQGLDEFHKREIVDKKCNCDWMCAIPINSLYDPKIVPRTLMALARPQDAIRR